MVKPPPTTLEQWTKGRSNFTAILAPQLLASAETLAFFCRMASKQSAVGAVLKQCPASEWVSLYRCNKGVFGWLYDLLEREGLVTRNMRRLLLLWLGLRRFSTMREDERKREVAKVTPEALAKAVRVASRVGPRLGEKTRRESFQGVRDFLAEAKAVLSKIDAGKALPGDAKLPPVPLMFFLLVWLPCGILYQTTPTRLIYRARHGDVEALGKMLRLDKLLLEEPRFRKVYYAALASRDFDVRRGFQKALIGKPPTADMRVDRIKKRLAALAQKWSDQAADIFGQLGVGQPAKTSVSIPDTQRLYDVLERERGDGERDADLPDEIHAWDVAVRREHRVWPDLGESHRTKS